MPLRFRTAVALAFLAVLTSLSHPSEAKTKTPKEPVEAGPSANLYKELDLFTKVLNLVEEGYVDNPNDRDMIYGAIRGLLSTLDPHSVFMTPDAYRELKVD